MGYQAKEGHRYQSEGYRYKVISCEKCGEKHVPHMAYRINSNQDAVWVCQMCSNCLPREERKSQKQAELDSFIEELGHA